MAEKKKGKTKKTEAKKQPELTAVQGGGEEKVPTPKDYVEHGLQFVERSIQALELSIAHLNDEKAGEYFKSLEPEAFKKQVCSAIGEYFRKAHYALESMRDELKIALQIKGPDQILAEKEARKGQEPAFKTPDVDVKTAVQLPSTDVTVAQLEEIEKSYDKTVLMLSHCQIEAANYKLAGETIEFQMKVRDGIRQTIAELKKKPAA